MAAPTGLNDADREKIYTEVGRVLRKGDVQPAQGQSQFSAALDKALSDQMEQASTPPATTPATHPATVGARR